MVKKLMLVIALVIGLIVGGVSVSHAQKEHSETGTGPCSGGCNA